MMQIVTAGLQERAKFKLSTGLDLGKRTAQVIAYIPFSYGIDEKTMKFATVQKMEKFNLTIA